jgi:hypothetical protein
LHYGMPSHRQPLGHFTGNPSTHRRQCLPFANIKFPAPP